MTYDAEDGYALLFGGEGTGFAYLNDTWTYANGNWTNVTSRLSTAPQGSASDLMAYDAADGYVVLYQGKDEEGDEGGSTTTCSEDETTAPSASVTVRVMRYVPTELKWQGEEAEAVNWHVKGVSCQ